MNTETIRAAIQDHFTKTTWGELLYCHEQIASQDQIRPFRIAFHVFEGDLYLAFTVAIDTTLVLPNIMAIIKDAINAKYEESQQDAYIGRVVKLDPARRDEYITLANQEGKLSQYPATYLFRPNLDTVWYCTEHTDDICQIELLGLYSGVKALTEYLVIVE